MQVRLLGPLELDDGDAPITVGGARLRALLARLALDAGRSVSTDALALALWDDAVPDDTTNAVQSLVSRLRRALPDPALVQSHPAGYRLRIAPEDVDALPTLDTIVLETALADRLRWRAAGLAVLDVIEQGDLRRNASEIGAYLVERFRAMQARHETIGDVRGMGLFLGIELVEDRRTKVPATALAKKICDGVRRRGALMGTEGPHDNVLKMRPPMIFTRADADLLVALLEETFEAVEAGGQ